MIQTLIYKTYHAAQERIPTLCLQLKKNNHSDRKQHLLAMKYNGSAASLDRKLVDMLYTQL